MKILILGWEYPPFNSGGLGVACMHICKALSKYDVNLSFLLPWKLPAQSRYMEFIFASDEEIKTYKPFMSGYMTPAQYRYLTLKEQLLLETDFLSKVLNYSIQAGEVVKKRNFDILHAHDWLTFPAGMKARLQSSVPLIAHVHSTEYDRCGGNSSGHPRCKEIEYEAMHTADQVIANSFYIKESLVREYNTPAERIEVVHNGIDLAEFHERVISQNGVRHLKDKGNKIVLYVGRFSKHKGTDYFIRAAKRVLKQYQNVYFILAGSGEQEQSYISLAASLHVSDRVLFAGFLRGSRLHEIYQLADIYVLPSVSEPFGMTVLESLAHKTPVIISRQSGVKEVVPNSLLIDFWDIDELTNKIVSVLRYPALHRCLSNNGLEDAHRNTWDKTAQKLLTIYEKIIQKKKIRVAT